MDGDTTGAEVEYRQRWVILGVMYLCILSFAFAMQSIPPVLSLILAELNLSHAQGGLLMGFFAFPGIIVSIPAGLLTDRYSQKAIGSLSLLLIITGEVISASGSSLLGLGLGRFVSGIGAATLVVMVPQLLAQWFMGREIGIAMGVFNTGMPLGTVLSLNFLSIIGERMGWRAGIWTSLGVAVLTLGVFMFLFAPAPRKEGKIDLSSEHLLEGLKTTGMAVWILGAAWLFFNAAVISVYTFTPDFLKASGFSVASAGFHTSVIMWPGLVMGVIVGWVIDKKGRKRLMIGAAGVIIAFLLLWVPGMTTWLIPLMLCLGFTQSFVSTPIFALVPDVVHPTRLGIGYGVLSTCVNVGIVAGPLATGWIKDVSGSYQGSYTLMSGFALMITVSMLCLGRRGNKPV